MCWNVAGLSTTVNRIQDSYGSSKPTAKHNSNSNNNNNNSNQQKSATTTPPQCHALSDYFRRHGLPDMVCLQEHKIPRAQLSNRAEPGHCAHLEGYESFWSCCVDDKRSVRQCVSASNNNNNNNNNK